MANEMNVLKLWLAYQQGFNHDKEYVKKDKLFELVKPDLNELEIVKFDAQEIFYLLGYFSNPCHTVQRFQRKIKNYRKYSWFHDLKVTLEDITADMENYKNRP